jgi:predicted nucleotidyltransferase
MDEKLRALLADLRSGFEAFYGERLVQMVLFGSQARGDAVPEADIDVLVVLQGRINPATQGLSR